MMSVESAFGAQLSGHEIIIIIIIVVVVIIILQSSQVKSRYTNRRCLVYQRGFRKCRMANAFFENLNLRYNLNHKDSSEGFCSTLRFTTTLKGTTMFICKSFRRWGMMYFLIASEPSLKTAIPTFPNIPLDTKFSFKKKEKKRFNGSDNNDRPHKV